MIPCTLKSITRILITFSLLASLLLTGCKNYQLGSSAELPFRSIYIQPVQNDSFAPQASAQVSIQLRETFIRDGRIRIVSKPENAEGILEVTLIDYSRTPAARSSKDTVRASDLDLTLKANFSLYAKSTGSFLLQNATAQNRVNAKTANPYIDASATNIDAYNQAERQSMPLLARGLSREIADQVLSPW